MATPTKFPIRSLSGNSNLCPKSIVISSIRFCGSLAIVPDKNGPLLKLKKAKELVAAADETIKDLAKDSGFKIPENMSKHQLLQLASFFKLEKAKEMVAAGNLEDAANLCGEAADEAVDDLAKGLGLKIPEDMSVRDLLIKCDRYFPGRKSPEGLERTFYMDYTVATQYVYTV
jgi:hypothetical protein